MIFMKKLCQIVWGFFHGKKLLNDLPHVLQLWPLCPSWTNIFLCLIYTNQKKVTFLNIRFLHSARVKSAFVMHSSFGRLNQLVYGSKSVVLFGSWGTNSFLYKFRLAWTRFTIRELIFHKNFRSRNTRICHKIHTTKLFSQILHFNIHTWIDFPQNDLKQIS